MTADQAIRFAAENGAEMHRDRDLLTSLSVMLGYDNPRTRAAIEAITKKHQGMVDEFMTRENEKAQS